MSSVLLASFVKAQRGGIEFSRSQRVLYTVCELWAAAMNESLEHYLGECAEARLHCVEVSFRALKLKRVARILRRGRTQLKHCGTPDSLNEVIKGMELYLARLREPVDQESSRFAHEQTLDRFIAT